LLRLMSVFRRAFYAQHTSFYSSIIVTLGLCLQSLVALGAYDRPVTWEDMSAMDLGPVFRSQYSSQSNLFDASFPESAVELVLRDADARVSDEFQIPAALRGPVEFWLRIYTQYTTQHVVLFDARHPEIVYEVLDFRPLAKTARNLIVYEILSKRKIESTVKAYREAFRRLSKNQRPHNLSPIEKKILSKTRGHKHRHGLPEFAKNLRTQTGQRDNIIKGLLAAEDFFPKMEQIFTGMGIPPELTRLSLVESSFNLSAVSRKGAAGVWQFMLKSAREYITVDEKRGIDERLSPLKSTVAAAKLLKRNRRILGTWLLAVTSYNHGLRGLRMISSTPKETDIAHRLFNPCSKKSRLGWASRNYYAEFLAVLYAETYRHLFYGDPPQYKRHDSIVFYRLLKKQSAHSFAMARGISIQEFRFLNPDIRYLSRTLPQGFIVAIPGDKDDLALLLNPKVKKNQGGAATI
jgi:membrane-bound lytic murein transglycosylase D